MRITYAVLCEYAVSGAFGKPTVVGIYKAFFARPDMPIQTSPSFIHALIESPSAVGPRHLIVHRLVDGDGGTVHEAENPIDFTPETINPSSQFAYTYAFIPPIELPGPGDYEWLILIDGSRIGSVEFSAAYMPDHPPFHFHKERPS